MKRLSVAIVAGAVLLTGCATSAFRPSDYPSSGEVVGEIELERHFAVWLYAFPLPEERVRIAFTEAEMQAREQFGDYVRLADVRLSSGLSIWSIPLYMLLSYGELVTLQADVVRYDSAQYRFTDQERRAIRSRSVFVGMSAAAARESLGRPDRINRTVIASGTREQWVYDGLYVYVENGVVTAYQD